MANVAMHQCLIQQSQLQAKGVLWCHHDSTCHSNSSTICKYVLVHVLAYIAVTYLHSLAAMTTMTKDVNNGI